jgi:hypothetical protein
MGPTGNVFAADQVDRGPGLLYDRQTTAVGTATAATYNFFTIPVGGTKTKADTNLVQGNRIPPPQAFHAMSLGFYFNPKMTLLDIITFQTNYWMEFKIGIKVFLEGPLQYYPAGCGLTGFAATNHATTGLLLATSNGDPNVTARRAFPDFPRTIPQNVYFGVNVMGTTFTTNASVAAVAGIGAPAYGTIDILSSIEGVYDREVM